MAKEIFCQIYFGLDGGFEPTDGVLDGGKVLLQQPR